MEQPYWEGKVPMLRIRYEGSPRSKYMRASWAFNKIASSSEKYDVPVYIQTKRSKSLEMLLIIGTIGGSAFAGQMGINLANDVYKYLKKKVKKEARKRFKSKISVFEVNAAFEEMLEAEETAARKKSKNDQENNAESFA